MEVLIKIAAICIAAAVFSAVIKKNDPAMALLISVAAGCVVMYMAMNTAKEVFDFVSELAEVSGMSPTVLSIMIKTVGIAVISKITSDVCKDAGMTSAATMSEFAGSAAALYVALPLMKTTLKMIADIL